jgi:hypothetical protein
MDKKQYTFELIMPHNLSSRNVPSAKVGGTNCKFVLAVKLPLADTVFAQSNPRSIPS